METLASSNQNSLVCSVRKIAVKATPEELVRQTLLAKMVGEWNYPHCLIQVEKAVLPLRRRFDIVVFYKRGETLSPLLVVECKAESDRSGALIQLLGYNQTLLAPFLGLADRRGFFCCSKEGSEVLLPTYQNLLSSIKINTSLSIT